MYILQDNLLFLFSLLHLALLFAVCFISCKGSKGMDRAGVCVIALLYILIVFTRQGLGVDEITYRAAYEAYLTDPYSVEFEYSFKLLLYIFQQLSVEPAFFNNFICVLYILLVSTLVMVTVSSPYKALCSLLFLFSFVSLDFIFNAYRQGFAFVFVFSSLSAFRSQRKILSALFMIIAAGFHWSSLLIPALLLSFSLVPKKRVKTLLSMVMVLTVLGFIWKLNILPLLNKLVGLIYSSNYYLDKIRFYLSTSESSIYDLNFFGRLPLLVSTLSVVIFCRCFYKYIDFFWIKLITAISLYCLIFMEMSFSFRNYYWLLPIFPFIICNALENYEKLGKNVRPYVIFVACWHVFISIVAYYTSPLIPLVFFSA